jgi:sulfite exporter TauE/SafE
MILRIIAFATLICLGLGTFGLANQVSLLPENTLHLSSDPSANLDLSITEQNRSMILGFGVGLVGCGMALFTEDEDFRAWALALGVLGLLWMELENTSIE